MSCAHSFQSTCCFDRISEDRWQDGRQMRIIDRLELALATGRGSRGMTRVSQWRVSVGGQNGSTGRVLVPIRKGSQCWGFLCHHVWLIEPRICSRELHRNSSKVRLFQDSGDHWVPDVSCKFVYAVVSASGRIMLGGDSCWTYKSS